LRQRAHAAIETVEKPLTPCRLTGGGEVRRPIEGLGARDGVLIGSTQVLEQDELPDDVAVAGRRRIDDLPFFLESAGDAVQRLVREIVGVRATFVLKISDQATARLEVTLATGVDALVQPDEQMLERTASRNPVTFQFGRDALCSSEVRVMNSTSKPSLDFT
jgi:hypothetical protein